MENMVVVRGRRTREGMGGRRRSGFFDGLWKDGRKGNERRDRLVSGLMD